MTPQRFLYLQFLSLHFSLTLFINLFSENQTQLIIQSKKRRPAVSYLDKLLATWALTA